MKNVSIVILSYNTKHITETAISKAKIAAGYCEGMFGNYVEIIVVDNHSTDGSAEMLRKQDAIRLIELPENMGAAVGYNAGMKVAKNEYIFLINNDTYLYQSTIYDAVQWMEQNTQADVVIGQLYDVNEQIVSYGGYLPTPFKTIRWILGLESFPIIKNYLRKIYLKQGKHTKDIPMEWIPTCFMFMRRRVYDVTQGHDEQIFFYMDDVEWCKRIKDAGFSIWLSPTIHAIHLGGKSTKDIMKLQFLVQSQMNGLLYYHKKHHPKTFSVVRLLLLFGLKLRACVYFMVGKNELSTAYAHITLKK